MNKPVPASPAQISDEQAVKNKYPDAKMVLKKEHGTYYLTTKMGAGGRISDYCENPEETWTSARSRLEPVEAASRNPRLDAFKEYRKSKDEPVEAAKGEQRQKRCPKCGHRWVSSEDDACPRCSLEPVEAVSPEEK